MDFGFDVLFLNLKKHPSKTPPLRYGLLPRSNGQSTQLKMNSVYR